MVDTAPLQRTLTSNPDKRLKRPPALPSLRPTQGMARWTLFRLALSWLISLLPGASPFGLIILSLLGITILVYRQRRKDMQIENNQLISRRIDEYTNISRFLRPFFTSGKLRTDIVPENFVDGVLLGHRWDLEFALTLALEGTSPLIALGDVHGEYGAAEIITSDEQWQSKMIAAANRALLIIVVPLNRPSTLWEVQQIFANTNLLQKTLFLMPPTKGIIHRNALSFFRRESIRRSWNSARTELLRTGVKVPTYTSKGRFFHLSKEGEVDAILPLRRLIPGWIKLIATCFEAADDSVGTRLQHVRERWTIHDHNTLAADLELPSGFHGLFFNGS